MSSSTVGHNTKMLVIIIIIIVVIGESIASDDSSQYDSPLHQEATTGKNWELGKKHYFE